MMLNKDKEPATPAQLIEAVTRDYALGTIHSCEALHIVPDQNATYLLRTEQEVPYILRLYGLTWRTSSRIAYEIHLLAHLAAKGVAVSTALPRKDGRFFAPLAPGKNERFMALFTYAEGEDCYGGSLDRHGYQFGRATASLYVAAASFTSSYEPLHHDMNYLLHEPLAHIEPWLQHRPADLSYLHHMAERTEEVLAPYIAAGLEEGICHGDLTSVNAHITSEGKVTFFDFDLCGVGWRAAELSQIRTSAVWINNPSVWSNFLEGYTEIKRFNALDLAAIPWFVVTGPIWILGNSGRKASLGYRKGIADKEVDMHVSFLRKWEAEQLEGHRDGQV